MIQVLHSSECAHIELNPDIAPNGDVHGQLLKIFHALSGLIVCPPVNFGALASMKFIEMKIFRLVQLILAMLMFFYFPTITFADRAFRCHGRLVYIGDPKADVFSKCGKPDHIEKWEENPNGYTSKIYDYEKERFQLPELIKGPILVERWTYNLGPNQFTRNLFFQNGELYKIERGDK